MGCGVLLVGVMALASCASPGASQSTKATADKAFVNKLLQQAYSQTLAKNDPGAEVLLLQAQKLDPANPWVALNLGAVYQRNGHRDLAFKQYEKVLALPDAEAAGQVSAGETAGASPSSIARANLKQMELASLARKRVTFNVAGQPDSVAAQEPVKAMEVKPMASVTTAATPPAPVAKAPVDATMDPKKELGAILNSWHTAWKGLDFNGYLSHYQSSFKGDKATREAWVASRKKAFTRNASALQIRIYDPIIKINGREAEISFKQEFESSNFNDSGVKVLKLEQSDGQWRINQETFFN